MINIYNIFKWVFLFSFLIFLIKYTSQNRLSKKLKIDYIEIKTKEKRFLSSEDILKYINTSPHFDTSQLNIFNTKELEDLLDLHPGIDNAEVYTYQNGNIRILVNQKKAIVRIKTETDDFYLDEYGQKMKLCKNYFPKLLVATGKINDTHHKEIFDFVCLLRKSNFWNSQISQIYFSDDDIFLIPIVGDHKINIGNFNNISLKLENLYHFYNKAISFKGWQTYSDINLKFNNQIVCTKR
tara:strand:+ start:9687 stop:10403 length:717 start_codon:yes stop_codon:yes gene_type:complete